MPTTEPQVPRRPSALAGVSMRDLLASCAAAEAVSRPPREPGPARPDERPARTGDRHREAA
ncbi:hypothetical protein ACIRPQ_12210 [Streptomyces sp. NPDC101213]|uniref:hypothetical protein n=1 Tax=unclassified Streptomyces TaxID=2593676 RepID=UPI00370006A8